MSSQREAKKGEDLGELVVVVVDDEQAVCELMADCLDGEPGMTCGGTARTPEEAHSVVREVQPDVLLFDGVRFHDRWPDDRRIKPLELAAELMAACPSMHMLIWTSWSDSDPSQLMSMQFRMAAIRAGAKDLLSKGSDLAEILTAIRETVGTPPGVPNERLWPDIEPLIPDDDWATAELTPTQARWASILAQSFKIGMTVQEVAEQHGARVTSLRGYVQQIYKAWNISNQVQLVMEAKHRGLAMSERRDLHQPSADRQGARGVQLPTVLLTCMDARLEDMRGLGDLSLSATHIVRNAGGRASDDALRSLAASCAMGAKRVLVAHHTDCAMSQIDNDALRRKLPDPSDATDIDFMTIDDQRAALHRDVSHIASSPLLPPGIEVIGLMYDIHAHTAKTVVSEHVISPAGRSVVG
ncbi:MAG TPA: hypothetical protein VH042_01350 [Solirubrobacterales bacterium]|nr:hypothetical protein [Solirubrobacterales bacterium]